MGLQEYQQKRDFKKTSEPKGKKKSTGKQLLFVIQKHAASHLHYDFRLEVDGVLKSWAIPKGPTLDPTIKRLAMMVEDHPYDYKDFEGIIPAGNYGAGKVIIWDQGTYHSYETEDREESEKIIKRQLHQGDVKFVLNGEKLQGKFALVKIKSDEKNTWLFIKKNDEFATDEDILEQDRSVISGKKVDQLGTVGEEKVWQSNKKTAQKKVIKQPDLKDAIKKAFPENIRPMLATLVKNAFDDPEWLFEIKWDGYRAIAEIRNNVVNLYSRNNLPFNEKFAPIAQSLRTIDDTMILDGEIVVVNKEGRPDFQLIQNYQRNGTGTLIYYVFDILYLNGYSLMELPLVRRKEILKQVLPDSGNILYGDHIIENGLSFFELAKQNQLEGMVAKKINSTYVQGKRTREWLKIKTAMRQEAIICGFTQPRGSRKNFGALVLGVYKNKELIYIGHTGGGFDDDKLEELYKIFLPLVIRQSPFKKKPKTNMPVTWVKPELVCEVTFTEWTSDGLLRHPIFLGLREDKKAEKVIREDPEEINSAEEKQEGVTLNDKEITIQKKKIKLSNLDKLYWPDEKYTKGDLIEYYRKISKYILPYLKDRPESLFRTPDGIKAGGFFQKDMNTMTPDWAQTEKIYSESNDKHVNYLICNDEATLVYMANLGCIEINPWFSRIQQPDNPDYLVIDLDPEAIAFSKVVETALVVKEVFDQAGITSYCKTSGATGIHIYVPLKAKYDYDTSKEFAHVIAQMVHSRIPEFTSLERSPGKRQRKVYLDYLQNRKGQTLAAPYSVRPKPGAPVSTPLRWEEVNQSLDPINFNINSIFNRLKETGDLFHGVLGPGINIEKSIKKLESRMKK